MSAGFRGVECVGSDKVIVVVKQQVVNIVNTGNGENQDREPMRASKQQQTNMSSNEVASAPLGCLVRPPDKAICLYKNKQQRRVTIGTFDLV